MKPTQVYFAGPYEERATLLERAREIEQDSNGIVQVTSTWLDDDLEAHDANPTVKQMRVWADDDIDDINASTILVQFTDRPSSRGGAHWECGYAFGVGLRVVTCGPVRNIFHAHDTIPNFADWPALKAWLIETSAEAEADR